MGCLFRAKTSQTRHEASSHEGLERGVRASSRKYKLCLNSFVSVCQVSSGAQSSGQVR